MRVLKSLITLVILILVVGQINAQHFGGQVSKDPCAMKYGTVIDSYGWSGDSITVNIEMAKSEAGDSHPNFIIKATPKKSHDGQLKITQKGNWFKGIFFYDPLTAAWYTMACACNELNSGSVDTYLYYGPPVDGILTLMYPNWSGLFIGEDKFLGSVTITTQIINVGDLDKKYDWTFEWKG